MKYQDNWRLGKLQRIMPVSDHIIKNWEMKLIDLPTARSSHVWYGSVKWNHVGDLHGHSVLVQTGIVSFYSDRSSSFPWSHLSWLSLVCLVLTEDTRVIVSHALVQQAATGHCQHGQQDGSFCSHLTNTNTSHRILFQNHLEMISRMPAARCSTGETLVTQQSVTVPDITFISYYVYYDLMTSWLLGRTVKYYAL